jgi:hypothetical protein
VARNLHRIAGTLSLLAGVLGVACSRFESDQTLDEAGDGAALDQDAEASVVTGTPGVDASREEAGAVDGSDGGEPVAGFDVVFPTVDLDPGQSLTTCYYLHTSNTIDVNIKSWASSQSSIVAHMALVFTSGDLQPPGTVSPTDCSIFGGIGTSWVYSSWTNIGGWTFPLDDGSGVPVGKLVKRAQSAYLVVEAVNKAATTQKATAKLHASAYAENVSVTHAEPYVASNVSINIGPGVASDIESKVCPVPAGAKFNWLSMYTHIHATRAAALDSAIVLFQTNSPLDPTAMLKEVSPFAVFASNQITYECQFANPSGAAITFGPNRNTEEACAVFAYHFPATKPRYCVDSSLVP